MKTTKILYSHSARRIPDEAIYIIDAIYEKRKNKEPTLRKCDLWIEAVNKLNTQKRGVK